MWVYGELLINIFRLLLTHITIISVIQNNFHALKELLLFLCLLGGGCVNQPNWKAEILTKPHLYSISTVHVTISPVHVLSVHHILYIFIVILPLFVPITSQNTPPKSSQYITSPPHVSIFPALVHSEYLFSCQCSVRIIPLYYICLASTPYLLPKSNKYIKLLPMSHYFLPMYIYLFIINHYYQDYGKYELNCTV